MIEKISYSEFQDQDFESLVALSLKLWKDVKESALRNFLNANFSDGAQKIIFAKNEAQNNIGFVIFSIRKDYVEGATQSPTGYLEGIYVEPEYRKHGIARHFIQLGEKWMKKNNCTQIGSDTWLSDTASRNFHKKLGFWEEDELVHFLKNI